MQYYNIIINNTDFAYIPYDTQTSYYISDASMQNMSFIFDSNFNPSINSDSQVTFWVKGKSITRSYLKNNTLKSQQYEYAMCFMVIFLELNQI